MPDTTAGDEDEQRSVTTPARMPGLQRTAKTLLLGLWVLVTGAVAHAATPGEETGGAPADPPEAVAVVRLATEQLLSAVRADRTRIGSDPHQAHALIERIVFPHVDLERTSRWILGRHWRRATRDQQQRFTRALHDRLVRTYALALVQNPDVEVRFLPPRPQRRPDESLVRTQIPRVDGPPLTVDYRMHRGNDGHWKVYDVVVEGVSMVSTYRASVGQQIRQIGIEGVIEKLQSSGTAEGKA